MEPNEGVALWPLLLIQREPPTEDVNPSLGREGCQFTTQLFQHPESDVRDPLEGVRIVEHLESVRGYLCCGERCSLMNM